MIIKVRTSLDFKKIFGQGRFEVQSSNGITLGRFLDQLVETWGDELASRLYKPDSGEILPYIMLMVNGQNINFLHKLDTVLKDQDEVLILPPVAGG
jgi:MoaD family protein